MELGGGGGRLAERGGPGPVRHHFKAGSRSLDREKGTVCFALSLAERGRSGSGHMHGRSRPPWGAWQAALPSPGEVGEEEGGRAVVCGEQFLRLPHPAVLGLSQTLSRLGQARFFRLTSATILCSLSAVWGFGGSIFHFEVAVSQVRAHLKFSLLLRLFTAYNTSVCRICLTPFL